MRERHLVGATLMRLEANVNSRHQFQAAPRHQKKPMSKSHNYVLGINAYDHDVSACLLRDGEIAFAIAKERITREKHQSGFFQEVVDYCLSAEGITLDDIDLVVRNCYVLPVDDLEVRMLSVDV